jgi:hypothetical protein
MADVERSPPRVEQLGTVRCPSGVLLVLDGGLASTWSHDRAPKLPDAFPSARVANSAVDLEVHGPDALAAGRAWDRSCNPLFAFDRPKRAVRDLRREFAAFARERGLDAELVPSRRRIPHRRRVDLALEVGGGTGVVEFHGMWAAAVGGVPRDAALPVLGERMPEGPDAGRWRRVWIEAGAAVGAVRSVAVGHVLVDEARLMAVDADALGAWNDEDPLDGRADVVFWGRDAPEVAVELDAPAAPTAGEAERFGWVDLPVRDALARLRRVVKAKEGGDRWFALDYRPHTHHWQVMRDVRATPTESGVLELAGARLCMFMTSWGDGGFPVEADLDAAGRLVRVRIELGCDEIVNRQRRMEERWHGAFAKHALVSARVARDGLPVRFLYREAPDRDEDSGWRIFAGDESDAYANDADNAILVPLRELLERDPGLEELLRTEAPCAFERPRAGEPFERVEGFVPRGD